MRRQERMVILWGKLPTKVVTRVGILDPTTERIDLTPARPRSVRLITRNKKQQIGPSPKLWCRPAVCAYGG